MSSPLLETVTAIFNGENWAFVEVPGRDVVQAGFEAPHGRIELHVQAFPELSAISVVSESSTGPGNDPARRERTAELLMRVNQSLSVGNFEMNWDSGSVLFRVTNIFSTEAGDTKIIRGLLQNAVMEMDRLTPLLSAIARAEGGALAGLDIAAMIRQSEAAAPESTP